MRREGRQGACSSSPPASRTRTGVERRRRLAAFCRQTGMRLVGPELPRRRGPPALDATFARGRPLPGRVALASQSGGVAIAALEGARAHGIGFSGFVSIGDRADLSSNDFLQYWETGSGNRRDRAVPGVLRQPAPLRPDRAPRGRTKPILAVKAGRTRSGRARGGHPHRRARRGSDATVDALFAQSGVHPDRHLRRAARLGRAALDAAAARRPPRRHRHQRGRPGDHVRGRVRGGRARGAGVEPGTGRRLRRCCPRRRPGNPVDLLGDARRRASARRSRRSPDDAGRRRDRRARSCPRRRRRRRCRGELCGDGLAAAGQAAAGGVPHGGGRPARPARRPAVPCFPLPEAAARTLAPRPITRPGSAAEPSPPAAIRPAPRSDAAAALVADSLAPAAAGSRPRPSASWRRATGCR